MSIDYGSFEWPPQGTSSGGGVTVYPNFAAFPPGTFVGELAIAADTGILYEWNGTMWVVLAVPSAGSFQGVPTGLINSSNVTYTLAGTVVVPQALLIFLDGIVINQGTDYTVSGTTLTMNTAPLFGQTLYSYYINGPSGGGGGSGITSINGDTTAAQLIVAASTGTDFTIATSGGTTTVAIPSASASNRGLLTSADWNTFNNKGSGTVTAVSVASANGLAGTSSGGATPALTLSTTITGLLQGNGTAISAATTGNLTDVGTDGITVTGGTGAVLGSGTSLSQHVADTTHNGYLSSVDWNTFNGKGSGTVTSVGLSVPATSILSVTGSPVTGSGTLGLVTTGTSGGIPYFSSTSQLASSALLTNHAIVLGGGAAASPTVLGSLGTTTTVLHGNAAGAPTFGAVALTTDVSGTLPIGNGGTGQATASAAFGALSPLTTKGDILGFDSANNRIPVGSDTQVLTADSTQTLGVKWATPTTGTVTSVSMTVPSFLSVSGSPVTTSGTLAVSLATETANTVFSGPLSGAAATPTFRPFSLADYQYGLMSVFGDGSDGNVTISSGITTLTRDMFYQNLTLSGTGTLNTNGYSAFISGTLDISAAQVAAIEASVSSNGGAGAAIGTGGSAGGSISSKSTGGTGCAGLIGAAGSTTNGVNATATTSSQQALGGASTTSGAGGTGASGTAGTSASGTTPTIVYTPHLFSPFNRITFTTSATPSISGGGSGGPGGGGGGGDVTNSGGGGGGGGAGGASIWINANTIARGSNSNASIIKAIGANGGNGGTPTVGNTGGGGGGSGGGGGYINITYLTLTGSTITNALDASGGAGGNGGSLHGTGTNGAGANSGGKGRITLWNLGSNPPTVSDNVGGSTTFNAPSGQTGGGFNTYQVSL